MGTSVSYTHLLAVDGRIIIRARYMEVEIDRDGTARLTLVPGKMETGDKMNTMRSILHPDFINK